MNKAKSSLLRVRGSVILCMGALALFTYTASAQWIQTSGPVGGSGYAFAGSGSNLFVGTDHGVFISNNSGTTWTPVNNGLTTLYVRSLVLTGINLFAGTYGGGVFLSGNNGVNWTPVNTGLLTSDTVMSLLINGSDVYAGTNRGVFRTTNNGTLWTVANTGLPARPQIYSLTVSGTNIFAGLMGKGVYITSNNGSNWASANNGMSASGTIFGLISNGSNLFAGTDHGVYLSTNNGAYWSAVNSGLPSDVTFPVPWVFAFTVSGTTVFSSTGAGIFMFNNTNLTWTSINGTLTTTFWGSLATDGTYLYTNVQYYVWKRQLSEVLPMLPPTQVMLQYPSDASVVVTDSVTLKWRQATPSVTKYHLQIATDSAMSFALQDSTITDTLRHFLLLTNGQSYWWRVRAFNAGGWGPFSSKYQLTINMIAQPIAVVPVSPINQSTIQGDSVCFVWRKANPLVTRYLLQVATDSAMSFSIQDSAITDTSKVLKPITSGLTYWWRVRAYNSAGWGQFSPIWNITCLSTHIKPTMNETHKTSFAMKDAAIEYSLPTNCFVDARLYDLKGVAVQIITKSFQQSGRHSLSLKNNYAPKGLYVLVFQAGNAIQIRNHVSIQ